MVRARFKALSELQQRGVPPELCEELAARLAPLSQGLSPEAYQGALEGGKRGWETV